MGPEAPRVQTQRVGRTLGRGGNKAIMGGLGSEPVKPLDHFSFFSHFFTFFFSKILVDHINGLAQNCSISRARFQKRFDLSEKVIGSLFSLQLTISWSDLIPRTILLRSDHDRGDPARHVDRCWIGNFITTIDHFISNITIVKIYKLPGNIYWMTWSVLYQQFVYFQWR